MKRLACFLMAVIFCLVGSSCGVSADASASKENFFDHVTYENDLYTWNNLTEEMTSKQVFEHEGLEEKDVVSSPYGKTGTSFTVRQDSEKMSQYKFADLAEIFDSCSAMYIFDSEDHFQEFNYDLYLNAQYTPDYSEAGSVKVTFQNSGKELEKVQSDIEAFLKKVEDKFGTPFNAYGTSETDPKFWENQQRTNQEEFYFEERFAKKGGFVVSVNKFYPDESNIVYQISIKIKPGIPKTKIVSSKHLLTW